MLLLVLPSSIPIQSIHFTEQINDELEVGVAGKLYYLPGLLLNAAGSPLYIFISDNFSKTGLYA